MSMEFVKIKKASKDRFISLVNLARANKLDASAIVKVTKKDTKKGQVKVIEMWRREGGTDMFNNPHTDIFDRIESYVPVDKRVFVIDPPGSITEDDLSNLDGVIILTKSIISNEYLPEVIHGLSRRLDLMISESELREAWNKIPVSFTINDDD